MAREFNFEPIPYDDRERQWAEDKELPQPPKSKQPVIIGISTGVVVFLLTLGIVLSTGKGTWMIFVLGPVACVLSWYIAWRWIAWHPNRKVS